VTGIDSKPGTEMAHSREIDVQDVI